MTPEAAETLAIQALGWVAAHPDLGPMFMGATGASGDDMRARADDPEFLISLLDFVMMDDAWVIEFCDAHGFAYTDPMMARQALPGGAETHWT